MCGVSEPLIFRVAVGRSPRAMAALDLEDLRECVDAVPKPFPMRFSTGRVIGTWQEWLLQCVLFGHWLSLQEREDFAQLVYDGCAAAEVAGGRVIAAITAKLESTREELLEALHNALKEAGGPGLAKRIPLVIESLTRQSRLVEKAETSLRSKGTLAAYTACAFSAIDNLISFANCYDLEGRLQREEDLREIKTYLNVASEWACFSRDVEIWSMLMMLPPSGPSGVNTVRSKARLMPVKQGVERELAQLLWDGTCAAWGKLEAAGVAVMNNVTAELEAMREELLEGLSESLHGARGARNDCASSLRTDMLTKVRHHLRVQSGFIEQAQSQRGPRRKADEHPFHVTCVSAIDNLIELQQALPMEFYILQSSRPKHRTESDLQEMKEHLKELLSASSDWGGLWEDQSWRKILANSGLHIDALAENDSLSLTPVKEIIQVSQAIKDRRQAIGEETAAKHQAEREAAEKENTELKARCDDLEERCEALAAKVEVESKTAQDISTLKAQYECLKNEHEALKFSLNAEASEAFAHRAWQGHGGGLISWNVVASGSAQTFRSTSWISVDTVGPCCFLKDAIFKIKKEDGFDFCEAQHLRIGSQVVAENGDIIEVKAAPEHHVVHEMVELETESALLQISPDHRIVRHDKSAVARPCKKLP